MTDPTAQTRSYICDKRFDNREGSEWQGSHIGAIIYHAGDQTMDWSQEETDDGRVKVTVLNCTDFMDAGFMSTPGVRRTTA